MADKPKRIVMKFGSGILAKPDGSALETGQFTRFAAEVSALVKAGHECVIVSSGAVAAGMRSYCALRARILHKESVSFGGRVTPNKTYYQVRNSLLLAEKRPDLVSAVAAGTCQPAAVSAVSRPEVISLSTCP